MTDIPQLRRDLLAWSRNQDRAVQARCSIVAANLAACAKEIEDVEA